MTKSRSTFEYSAYCDQNEVAEYLESRAASIRRGSVRIASGDDSIEVAPGNAVRFQIVAENRPRRSRGSIDLRISWRRAGTARDRLRFETDPADDARPIHLQVAE